jgi:alkylhydroperoxidase family enzyme
MPHIEEIPPERAEGATSRAYDEARRRAGRIWNIVSIMSQNGQTMTDSMRFYSTVMFGDSPLSRAQREMIAVVTSQVNTCHY